MKILLVAPAVEKYLLRAGETLKEEKTFRFSLLSLLAVAACTPAEHEVIILDEHIEVLDFDQPVDLVGVTCMTAHAPRAYEIGAGFRARGVPVVFGGFHPTFLPEEALQHGDAVVVGEAEGVWPRVVADAARGRVKGIYRAEAPVDLATLRTPPRHLLKQHEYFTINTVQATRGCEHRCAFCSIHPFFGGRFRTRPVEQVVDELAAMPARHFLFIDDNLTNDPAYARALFHAMIPLGKRWVTQASLRLTEDRELLALASRAGCRGVFVGLESIDPATLAAVGKEPNRVERYRDAVKAYHDQGIGVEAGVMFGFEGDRPEVFERTLAFLDAAGIDAMQASVVTPLPGTQFYAEMAAAGRILDRNWRHYDFRHAVFQPRGMSPDTLQQGVDWIIREFYRLPRVLRRVARGFLRGDVESMLLLGLPVNLGYARDARRFTPETPPPYVPREGAGLPAAQGIQA